MCVRSGICEVYIVQWPLRLKSMFIMQFIFFTLPAPYFGAALFKKFQKMLILAARLSYIYCTFF